MESCFRFFFRRQSSFPVQCINKSKNIWVSGFHNSAMTLAARNASKRIQLANIKKKKNKARQAELREQRKPNLGNVITGQPTEWTQSLYNPVPYLSGSMRANNTMQECNHFTQKQELNSILESIHKHLRKLRKQSASNFAEEMPAEHDNLLQETKDEYIRRLFDIQNSNFKSIRLLNIQKALRDFGHSERDTGSPEVQAAVYSAKIFAIKDHCDHHRKDYACKRYLSYLVHRRRRILKYLRRKDRQRYDDCISRLGLTDAAVTCEINV
ncbi:ribosomal protein subunit S28 [Schizosaccharomyces japonicus yFS275]|uniref:Ribosomal protein subunit S28 n=1 Tax=Schizosaccharomyces japonicus (strain yFS275 / FY16936) TaxID=402676 RepID=B6K371_SCHJY|nr:ribosomal protein subunit S28 [Schizosaccharomyces japonicus yFS275]EEB07928.1 ribosomal protein subunit S28 [Schizosaccharomyces japonicus yFS275]